MKKINWESIYLLMSIVVTLIYQVTKKGFSNLTSSPLVFFFFGFFILFAITSIFNSDGGKENSNDLYKLLMFDVIVFIFLTVIVVPTRIDIIWKVILLLGYVVIVSVIAALYRKKSSRQS